ncbi:MAG: hypothetical protein ACYSSI_10020 [Planctomycetota bacterium]
MSIDNLLKAVGRNNRFLLAERAKSQDWVKYPIAGDSEFVPPPLEGEIPGGTRIVLLSGPGAAGKSILAKWCAARSDIAYFNLAGRTVARDSARGFIGEAFSDSRYSEVVRAIREGQYTLILDALDEARLASGEDPFIDFLSGLADLVREHKGCVPLILFSRDETADWAELIFDDLKLTGVARLRLQPFAEREQAIEVIFRHCRRWHQKKNEEDPPPWSREMSEELLDVAQEVAKGFGDDETQQKAFWGYGALLASLGRLLAEEILAGARRGDLRKRFTAHSKLGPDLFIRVAQELLEREQKKFIEAAYKKLKLHAKGFSDWSRLYSKDEQCRRLLSRMIGIPLHDTIPQDLPGTLRDAYETLVNQMLSEHPFVGLSPYEEYLRAYFLVRETDDNRRRDFQRFLDEKLYLPTPILAWCMLTISPVGNRLRADNLGYLIESWLAHPTLGASFRVIIEGSGNNIVVQVDDDCASWIPEIRLTETHRSLWFWRSLKRATIDVDCNISIGTSEHDFILGPDVELKCNQLKFDSRSVNIRTVKNGNDGEEVILRAHTIDGPPRLNPYGPKEKFLVFGSNLRYPWAQWRTKEPPVAPSDEELRKVFADLRRLLIRFRARGYGELGKHSDVIHKYAVGQDTTRQALLDYCIKRKVMFLDGRLYKLDSRALDELGINQAHLHNGILTTKLAAFLKEFIEERQVRTR